MNRETSFSARFARAQLLLSQHRPDQAIQELRQALAEEPDNAAGRAVLALALIEAERPKEALREAQQAIHLEPDNDFHHYVHSFTLFSLDRHREAEAAVREAIRLDPEDADYHGLLAAILIDVKRGREALAEAEAGLRIDAEHVRCNNMRAMALTQLGRRAEAGRTLDAALARDPDDALTHANQGWTRLHESRTQDALESFREALRLDPTCEYARAGIVQALRGRYFIYRIMLGYFLWMSRLSGKAQAGLLVGAYVLVRILSTLARQSPALKPVVLPIVLFYMIFVFLSWTAGPIFDLLLRLNRFGRLALNDEQIRASNWVGGLFGSAVLLIAAWALSGCSHSILLLPAAFCAMMTLPVSATLNCPRGGRRIFLTIWTLALAVLALCATGFFFGDTKLGLSLALFFLAGWVLFSWAASTVHLGRTG